MDNNSNFNNEQDRFIEKLKTTAIINNGQFQIYNEEPEYRLEIWGAISSIGPLIVIRITNEAVKVIDKVIDIIVKCKKGSLITLEIKCPDGKTEIRIEAREKEIRDKLILLKEICKQKR